MESKNILLGLLIGLLLCRTWFYVPQYKDMKTLMLNNVETFPESAEAHLNLGAIYQTENKPEEAKNEYYQSLKLDHNIALVYYNLGILYKDNLEVALGCFYKAHELDNKNPKIKEMYKYSRKIVKKYGVGPSLIMIKEAPKPKNLDFEAKIEIIEKKLGIMIFYFIRAAIAFCLSIAGYLMILLVMYFNQRGDNAKKEV